MKRSLACIGVVALGVAAPAAFGQGFLAPGGVGPAYSGIAPPVNVPITGWMTSGPASNFVPNGFVFQSYGGIGPFGGPAYGRVLAGSNVVDYSNAGYSSFSGQYGGLGVPGFANRVGGYSATSSGFSVGAGGVAVYGAQDAFGYARPGLFPALSGGFPFGPGAGGLYPLGTYGSIRSGSATFLPRGGY